MKEQQVPPDVGSDGVRDVGGAYLMFVFDASCCSPNI